ncbi:pyridoxal phosphate-dependent decarboxylase family protein [Kitasatospora sp. NPDC051984]|uniref:pyridoxal phosphate-dependent decarboxylase family protein n=1 Tax=Kitasatospora sp. NPDC051984 TaxID=3364059 RepID=UPI0037C9DAF8
MYAAPDRMHKPDAELVELVFDYMRERLQYDPVPLDHPGDGAHLREVLAGLLNDRGNNPADVLKLYDHELSRAVISADSPRYLSFIPCAPTKAALLFDMVVSCASLQGISWLEAAGAIAAENQVLRLIADRAGLPATAGGVFVSGGSAGNLSALVVARDTARRRLGVGPEARLRIAVADQVHSSVKNTFNIIGVEAFPIPAVDRRLTGAALRAALDADPHPETVIAVVGTAGTTNEGIIDDLAGIAEVARERELWFHVDGAYGGAGLFAPSVRERYNGIEHADSFVVDPHKWLFAPFDCAALLYRDPRLARAVHTQDAGYLDVLHTEGDEWNPTDYAYHLTRRARGLPLWFSLAVHGVQAYTDAIETGLRLAQDTAQLIRDTEHLELLHDPQLSAVCFRRTGWTHDDYYRWSRQLLADQIGFVTPTGWDGETVARFAFLHPGTTMEMVQEILDTMR